ncbi:MAG: hypothetical protein SFY70_09300 [Bacteroidia bacterium]|nr:hypothetical protein [Bacteroidia bacterium]
MNRSPYPTLYDPEGNPTAVVVPLADFERMQAQVRRSRQLLKLGRSLQRASAELRAVEAGKAPARTLEAFLAEVAP